MESIADAEGPEVANPPKAVMMALIAFVVFNIGVGTIFGTPGVLFPHMQTYLGVSAPMVAAGMALVFLCSAIAAPQIGSLAVKHSLRGILAAAVVMLTGAWLLMAFTRSYPIFLAVYGLLIGPSMAITGSIMAPTLITRWFIRHRGLAIGLVHLPIMVAIMPVAAEWLIQHLGLKMTFLALAGLTAVTLGPLCFLIVDWPPQRQTPGEAQTSAPPAAVFTLPQMLRSPRFWALSIAAGMPNTSSTLLGLHLISMAEHRGVAPLAAASLASVMSVGGLVGSVAMGWLADKIGGPRTLGVIAGCDVLLWLLFLAGLPYAGLAALVATIGLLGSGSVPAVSKAFADRFGRASFSRAIGLMVPVTLPLLILGQVAPAAVVRAHGDYSPVVVMMACGLAVAGALAFWAARGPIAQAAR